jgi:hypothetical protein
MRSDETLNLIYKSTPHVQMAFREAIHTRNIDEVQRLGHEDPALLKAFVRCDFQQGRVVQPLQNAIYHQNMPMIRCLVQSLRDAGYNPNIVVSDQAATTVQTFRDRQGQLWLKPDTVFRRTTLLHLAARLHSTNTIEYLATQPGADVDRTINHGETPLMMCSENTPGTNNDAVNTVAMLLRCGANPYMRNVKGESVSDILSLRIAKYKRIHLDNPVQPLNECKELLNSVMNMVSIRVYDESTDGKRTLAILMGLHHKLGAASILHNMNPDILQNHIIRPEGTARPDTIADMEHHILRGYIVDAMRTIRARGVLDAMDV